MIESYPPYILVCGSYKNNRNNDKLCFYLGNEFARQNFSLVSAGGMPAVNIATQMFKTLADLDKYDSGRILTFYRTKASLDEIKVKRIGHHIFVGNNIHDIRLNLFNIATIVLSVGGNTSTKQEILMAQERKIPIIPIGMSKGTSLEAWRQLDVSGHKFDEESFAELNNGNVFIAANAAIDLIKKAVSISA